MSPNMSLTDVRISAESIRLRKGGVPIVCLTAYTYPVARLLDDHVDLLLVGDSLAMVLYGHKNTLGASLEMMIAHGQAVMRGSAKACVVVDMPAGSYESSTAQAVASARRIVDETGCQAVKLEGGVDMIRQISAIVAAGIPVMGHIGLQPQSVEKDGGYRIKGRTQENVAALLRDADAVEKAGAFSLVIEGTVETVAADLTRRISIPTIGIGASGDCDGQILVVDDMLGLTVEHVPKFVKAYADLRSVISNAATSYAAEVRSRRFPGPDHVFPAISGPATSGPVTSGRRKA
ncbi:MULTISPECIES: 3-methyl-2-oxobutanoate hydroxymethyltransferase [unclassified Mesorhizobium]|uniref:3-methyl-2-oxobutanoate hydroxymethyltransferase n=1 Tax=unclassified Mesorhizobium TaxID=325217 RepID=UPI000FD9536A|nr:MULTISPECIES: 3-methyl-2-oxobutanoate hydroxymethyltransferase [unclassified Mesorhizobium]TGQ31875.1 3-methyl-2-oxobutanoate hydroxymethyltransferase [Mesorhizobium sp. M00.F.Ca.ET.216.01.1.1]TIS58261.1 MAG: 3-methyl-2-oxobutanoate hydroxymethyltransferase [Mesorhizobium sp.]TIS92780.1 MAG: 3-methyl-2-oxobutanoate hydroxymethyltransferase [Mesorhizobium sp.]TJW18136.1 MAG: 3-methyl-2-oxobutanoate hydroxymethyltransferase [Mesorhizobium sp.]TJW47513.1 MAG: 3-methyl-2-oxobutanoate hydroxymet